MGFDAVQQQRQERVRRIAELQKVIQMCFDKGRNINKEKLIAEFSIKWAASRRTILEYLSLLKQTMGFILTKEEILPFK